MSAVPTPDPAAGALLARRHRLEAVIGEGAMGSVWRALDLQTGASVAVKMLLPHVAADEQLRARFEREIDAGRRLAHPNVMGLLDDGHDPCFGRFMVMPLLAGSDLRTLMGGGLGLRRSVALAEQLLAALDHVHDAGLVHRDVKPENLRVVDDGRGGERLVLFDFGLVKPTGAMCRERRLTEAGRVFGTPWYMAPEQAVGGRIDHRVDLYAVGTVLYEMLCGAPPFEGTLVQVLYHQVHTEPGPLPGWVPPPIARIVMGLLAKRPAARPACARDVARALRRAMVDAASQPTRAEVFELGTIAVPTRPTTSVLRGSRRHGGLFGALVAGAIAAAAWFTVAQPGDAEPTATVATGDAEVVAIAPETESAPISTTPSSDPPAAAVPVATPSVAALAAALPPPTIADSEPVRASASDLAPRKPSASRPARRPPARVEASPPPVRSLVPSKPPRGTSKLPGATALASVTRDAGGTIILRPQS